MAKIKESDRKNIVFLKKNSKNFTTILLSLPNYSFVRIKNKNFVSNNALLTAAFCITDKPPHRMKKIISFLRVALYFVVTKMKISLSWLKEYIDIPAEFSPERIAELLTSTGLEVEGIEEIESIKGGLEGVVVGLVKTCEKHRDADRLSVTSVEIGGTTPLNIVCGAPNVAAGQKVLVATIGTTLYPVGNGEPMTIKKGKIRGEVSEGMICAADELGIGADHSGIMILPSDVPVGTKARDYLGFSTDFVIEIGLTPNRSDATSHLGVAKDLAALFRVHFGHLGVIKSPFPTHFSDHFLAKNDHLPMEIVVKNTTACPRYAGVAIEAVAVGESPDWLKRRLAAIGVRAVNNIVDATNYVLHSVGQPLHAFDYDKISGQKIIVQNLSEGTKFTALDGEEYQLSSEDLMICDADGQPMCIGGVFGGIYSGVSETTKNIFLESAHFQPRGNRRSSTRHGLRTEAAKIFEKGSDPNLCVSALQYAAQLIVELAGGSVASSVIDQYPTVIKAQPISVSYQNINKLIGVDIDKTEIKNILNALEINIISELEEQIEVVVPTNKADVLREADVIEEILRIYGFDRVPTSTSMRTSMTLGEYPDNFQLKNTIGDLLAANGFQEMMAVSLTQSSYFTENIVPQEELIFINNTSNVTLNVMRPKMLFSGLEAIAHNQNRQQNDLKLFEFGKIYRKIDEHNFFESHHLSLFLSGKKYPENWIQTDRGEVNFFTLKTYVHKVLARLGIDSWQETPIESDAISTGIWYHRGQQTLVRFGKVQEALLRAMEVRQTVYYADFYWESLMKITKKQKISFEGINKYPSVRRDLALVIDRSVKFSDISALAQKTVKKLLKSFNLFDVYENEQQLGEGKKSYAVSFVFEDVNKTLTDHEVDKMMSDLECQFEANLGALVRR